MFFWNSLAFPMIQRMLAIWSLVPLPFLKPAWTSGSSRFTYWSLAWRILSITLLACEMSAIERDFEHSLALPFFGIGMKTDLFQSCGHCWVFQICWHMECSTFTAKHPYSITKQNVRYKWYMLLPFTFHCLFISDMAHVSMKKHRERIMALWPRKRGKRAIGGNFGNLDIKYNGLGPRWIKE